MNSSAPNLKSGRDPVDTPVDAVQREVMGAISPDGMPPPLSVARAEWKWFAAIALPLAFIGIAVLVYCLGVQAGVLASLLLAGTLLMTVPVWGAGLMRGKEERIARRAANAIVGTDRIEHRGTAEHRNGA